MVDPRSMLFTSESVTEGHPDKVCDQISDAVLDKVMADDPKGRVACETLVATGLVVVAGEITTSASLDYQKIARKVIERIGYNDSNMGFDYKSCAVMVAVNKQSTDIAMGVDREGAGDQGMMFGYACNETPELMPLPIMLAQKLTLQLASVRRKGGIKWLRPDGKSQVTVEYIDGKPVKVDTVVVSTQHDPLFGGDCPSKAQLAKEHKQIEKEVTEKIIKPVLGKKWWNNKIKIFVNPTGRFVIGGPHGDTGVTGRKIIVDTYGGMGRHGGGAFSGKDPSKVDRSAAYAARWIAKNIVASGIAERCEVQIAYAIGVAEPVSVNVNTFGTGKVDELELIKAINANFDLRPKAIIEKLKLRRPIYEKTAAYGHFGRELDEFTWEKTDMANVFKKLK